MKNEPSDSYSKKEPTYYQNVRREILPYVQPHNRSVLEVGCGEGATLRYLRDQCGASWVGGIEAYQPAARAAAQHLDWISINDVESPDAAIPDQPVDILLLLDVLEHLREPWDVLRRIVRKALKPGGTVVVTLPNIRNIRVLAKLFAQGRWEYTNSGILDRTHLRFFTRRSGLELLEQAHIKDIKAVPLIPRRLQPLGGALRLMGIDEFAASQILFTGNRSTLPLIEK